MPAEELEELTNAARLKLYETAMRIQKGGTMSPTEYGGIVRRLGDKYTRDPQAPGKLSTSTLSLDDAREALAELLEAAGEAPPPEATS